MKILATLAIVALAATHASADPLITFATSGPSASTSVVMTIDPNDFVGGYNTVSVDINAAAGTFADPTDTGMASWAGPSPSGTDTDFNDEITEATGSGGLGATQFSYSVDGTNADGIWASLAGTSISSASKPWLEMIAPAGTQITYTVTFVDAGQQVAQITDTFTVPGDVTNPPIKVPAVLPIGLAVLCAGFAAAGSRILKK